MPISIVHSVDESAYAILNHDIGTSLSYLHVVHKHLHGASDGNDVVNNQFGEGSEKIPPFVKFFDLHILVHLIVVFFDEHKLLHELAQLRLERDVGMIAIIKNHLKTIKKC